MIVRRVIPLLWLLWFSVFALPAAEPERPNVLFIAVDDLNDWVGCLGGHPQAVTPNIDRLAARGCLFTNAHCAAPLCNPSRTAVLTGWSPATSGVHGNEQDWRRSPYLEGHPTLPRWFQQHGYRTAACGKVFHANHGGECAALNGGHGGLQGFDDVSAWDARFPAADRQLVAEPVLPGQNFNGLDIWHWDWGPVDVPDAATVDGRAVAWAESQLRRDAETPFFLAVGLYRPHSPWYVPRVDFDAQPACADIRLPVVRENDLADVPAIAKGYLRSPDNLHAIVTRHALWPGAVRAYLANIAFADRMVGRLLDALDASPHADNTVVVLWSDHGWHLGEKQRWHKSTLWEEATRVPLIVIAPGVTLPDSRCDRAVSLLDLYPTLCDLARLPQPERLDGTSLRPLLVDPQATGHPPAVTILGGQHASVRTDRWRYTRYGDDSEELYDHDADPHEWTNLAADPRHRAAADSLARHLPGEIASYPEDHAPPHEPGFRPLFNGYDLTGWQDESAEQPSAWRVREGALAGERTVDDDGPAGLSFAGGSAGAFTLRFDYTLSGDAPAALEVMQRDGAVMASLPPTPGGEDGRAATMEVAVRNGRLTATRDGRVVREEKIGAAGSRGLRLHPPRRGRLMLRDLRLRDD